MALLLHVSLGMERGVIEDSVGWEDGRYKQPSVPGSGCFSEDIIGQK